MGRRLQMKQRQDTAASPSPAPRTPHKNREVLHPQWGHLGKSPPRAREGCSRERAERRRDLHPHPAGDRGLTHTFISLADSYTPTVRRSWRCAATSSSSTAALTVCILGRRGGGQRPAAHRALGPRPARPGPRRSTHFCAALSHATSSSRVMLQL